MRRKGNIWENTPAKNYTFMYFGSTYSQYNIFIFYKNNKFIDTYAR
jgi:hypothetical protein